MKRLVAAAHARGLMILLDVVYNHFGPDGNYLHAYAPDFFNAGVHTPWGAAINFDRPATRSHDYTRHGTTTLFAALCTMTGRLVHRTERRHTHVEWLRFLKQINREVEPDLDVHIICDNYCTHKHAKVRQWLSRHRRFHIHFTPTSASWLNLVERFFSTLTTDVVRRGSFRSVPRLERTLHTACEHQNQQPTPYNWTATADEILAKLHLDE